MNAIERLAQAIGYPDRVGGGDGPAELQVDGFTVAVREDALRLVFSTRLDFAESQLVAAAGYAAGRLLREEATLTWDPTAKTVLLFQAVDSQASPARLRAAFERFLDSCDWWRERAAEADGASATMPEMMFMP